MQVNPIISYNQDFKLKPVSREEGLEPWASFQEIFNKSIKNLSQSNHLQNDGLRDGCKYFLLQHNGESQGILIYSEESNNRFDSEGFKSCIEVKVLHISQLELQRPFIQAIISKIKEIASAKSIVIHISDQAEELIKALKSCQFLEIKAPENRMAYGFDLQEPRPKRKHPTDRYNSFSDCPIDKVEVKLPDPSRPPYTYIKKAN